MTKDTQMEITQRFNELRDLILQYESGTFSASATGINALQAERVARELVLSAIQNMIDCNTLDGVILSETFESTRA